MKQSGKRSRIFYGTLLLVGGMLLMLVPQLIHLQGHAQMRHAIIVLGAVCVLLSYPLFFPKRKS